MRPIHIVCSLIVFGSNTGCNEAPDELRSNPVLGSAVIVEIVPGYFHHQAASKFRIAPPSAQLSQVSEFGFSKTVGQFGVFAVRQNTGWAVAVPNGDAPARKRPPLTASGEAHNERVLAYFRDSGLPFDQVARVNAHATVSHSGAAAELNEPTSGAPILDWYSSVVTRTIEGIPVPDSFAVARFSVDDEVVSESVYWPGIPATVLAHAKALRAKLNNPPEAASYRAKLPSEVAAAEGAVVIRHTGCSYDGPFEASVSYDVMWGKGMRHVRHFDASATEFQIADTPKDYVPAKKP